MTFHSPTWTLVAGLALAVPGIVAGSPAQYHMEVLPVPPGCDSYAALHGLDSQGRAIGTLSCDDFVTQRAVLWTGETLIELGTFGGPNSYPYGIGPRGEVIGFAETLETYEDGSHVYRAFVWDDGSLHDLGTLGGDLGGALAVNSRGTVVGGCQPARMDPILGRAPMRPCVWEHGDVREIAGLGGPEAWAVDVNDRGWVAGTSDTTEPLPSGSGFAQHAFLDDGRTVQDLGTLGGLWSFSLAVSDRGEVVGGSLTGEVMPNGYALRRAFLWRNGELHDLGTLGGPSSEAADINNRGQAVGWSWVVAANGAYLAHAALWDGGHAVDLNDVVENPQNWTLNDAKAINERGQILANARGDGVWRTVILTPAGRSW